MLFGVLVLGVLIGLGVWWAATHLGCRSIQEVKARCDGGSTPAEAVRVQGEVASAWNVPMTSFSVYRLADKSDAIWVVSEREAPPEGAPLKIRGRPRSMRAMEESCAQGGYATADDCRALGLVARFIAGSCVLFEDERLQR